MYNSFAKKFDVVDMKGGRMKWFIKICRISLLRIKSNELAC